jgi:hypothetical protein
MYAIQYIKINVQKTKIINSDAKAIKKVFINFNDNLLMNKYNILKLR